MTTMKQFDFDLEYLNELMLIAMKNRGFIQYSEDCRKLDLHLYYVEQPISIEQQKNMLPVIKVRLKIYHANQDVFITYGYKAFITSNGFRERHSFSYEYSYVLKIIRRLLHESGVYDEIKKEI